MGNLTITEYILRNIFLQCTDSGWQGGERREEEGKEKEKDNPKIRERNDNGQEGEKEK